MIHLDGMDYVTNEEDWLFEEGAEEEDLEDLRDSCLCIHAIRCRILRKVHHKLKRLPHYLTGLHKVVLIVSLERLNGIPDLPDELRGKE